LETQSHIDGLYPNIDEDDIDTFSTFRKHLFHKSHFVTTSDFQHLPIQIEETDSTLPQLETLEDLQNKLTIATNRTDYLKTHFQSLVNEITILTEDNKKLKNTPQSDPIITSNELGALQISIAGQSHLGRANN
jgi:hypothetical protein